jgi:hypothetical protein
MPSLSSRGLCCSGRAVTQKDIHTMTAQSGTVSDATVMDTSVTLLTFQLNAATCPLYVCRVSFLKRGRF